MRVFNYYNVDMTSGLTITRLALNIFLKNYYKIKEIALIDHIHIFDFIKRGYYGGITEVYKPYGTNLKYIDINSLYPFVALQAMPGLQATFLESFTNEGLKLENLFGFFEAEIDTSSSEVPYLGLLPIHQFAKASGSLILPSGNFKGT